MQAYTLFKRPRNAPKGSKWERVSGSAYSKQTAIRQFQSALIAGAFDSDFTWSLRPVKAREPNETLHF